MRRDTVIQSIAVSHRVESGQIDIEFVLLAKEWHTIAETERFVLFELAPVDTVEAREIAVVTCLQASRSVLTACLLVLIQTFIAILEAVFLIGTEFVVFNTIFALVTISTTRLRRRRATAATWFVFDVHAAGFAVFRKETAMM